MDGGQELIKLAHLLGVSADAARDIARLRPHDAERIEQLAAQAEAIAAEFRTIAAAARPPARLRLLLPSERRS